MKIDNDFIESLLNMVVGVVVNGAISMLLFDITTTQALGATLVFIGASWVRHIVIRKIFRKLEA